MSKEVYTKEEKMRMLHTVRLMDYGTPSFISSVVQYIGNIESIKKVIRKLNKSNRERLETALNDYLSGGNGNVSVMYEKESPFVTPIKVKKRVDSVIENFEYTFMNVWDCPYYMVADKLEQTVFYVKIGKEYCRYISCKFTNLAYKNDDMIEDIETDENLTEEEKKERIAILNKIRFIHERSIGFWGHPGVIECNGNITKNNLYFIDKRFKSYQEVLKDFNNPEDIRYDGFFFDIFGDG